jgi:peptidoglycan/LPS O-acetylase OafA/YrhL
MEATPPKPRFITHLHAFRGFAIINIVVGHAFNGAIVWVKPETKPDFDRYLSIVKETVFHDTTIYFALISGLLYAMVLSGRSWGSFYWRKLLYVFCPYVLISTLLTLWQWPLFLNDPPYGAPFTGGFSDFLQAAGANIVTGEAMYHLWYIPVLAMLFLATPLISALLKDKGLRWVVVVLVLLPLVVSRVGFKLHFVSVVYFLGAYALGILAGSNYDRWLGWVERHLRSLAGVAVLLTLVIAWMYQSDIRYAGPVSIRESAFYVQKLAIAAVALALLKRGEANLPKWLNLFATYAFAIYFLHAFVIYLLNFAANAVLPAHPGLAETLALSVVWLAIALGVSVTVAAGLHRLLGKKSRMLVGA